MGMASNLMWSIRPEGAVVQSEPMTYAEIVAGIETDRWAGNAEVLDLRDGRWHRLDEHPEFLSYFPLSFGTAGEEEAEEELDLTPMIDVTFQLIIFFMITASFTTLRALNMPAPRDDQAKEQQARQITEEELEQFFIKVEVTENDGYVVDGIEVAPEQLACALSDAVSLSGKREVAIAADAAARHGQVVRVIDAAQEAKIETIRLVELNTPSPE